MSKRIILPLEEIDQDLHQEFKSEVGDLIINDILRYTNQTRSPVYGDKFPDLSSKYKNIKAQKGGQGVANLRLEGDLMASISWSSTDNGIIVGVADDQEGKADGHCNLSGASKLPLRRFIPDVEESFHDDIMAKVERVTNTYKARSETGNLDLIDLLDGLKVIGATKAASDSARVSVLLEGFFDL